MPNIALEERGTLASAVRRSYADVETASQHSLVVPGELARRQRQTHTRFRREAFVALLSQHRVVDADDAGDGSADKDTLVPAVDSRVEALNRRLVKKATKSDALGVHDVRHKCLDDAERQGVDDVLGLMRLGAGSRAGGAGGAQVEEVAKEAGQNDACEGPGQGRRPEARRQEQEHVGQVDWVIRGAQQADGGHGEGITVGEDLGTDEVQLKGRDAEQNAGDGAKGLARSLRRLSDAALLVNGGDALPHGDSGPVDGVGDVCRGRGQGNARGDLGQAARGRARDRRGRSGAAIVAAARVAC